MLLTGLSMISYMIVTLRGIRWGFSTDSTLILWKSIINLCKNAYINITLFFKCFPQCCYKLDVICGEGVKNGVLICGIIDSFYSDLSERIITRTPVNCQPLVYIMWGRLQNLTDNEKSFIMSLKWTKLSSNHPQFNVSFFLQSDHTEV